MNEFRPAADCGASMIDTGCCHDCGGRCFLRALVAAEAESKERT
jgi:hypothetical protein